MNKEKQLKKTMKKLKLQRDEAVQHAAQVGDSAEALAQAKVAEAAQAKKEAERLATVATMDSSQLREELRSLDEQLKQAKENYTKGLNSSMEERKSFTVALRNAEEAEKGWQEALAETNRQTNRHIDSLNTRIAELEAFKSEHSVKTLQKRLAKKSEELRLMTAERDRLKAEMFHLQAIGRTVRLPRDAGELGQVLEGRAR